MTPTEFRHIRTKVLKLSHSNMAKLLCVNIRNAQRYESGELKIPEWVIKILKLEQLTKEAMPRKGE